MKSAIYLTLTLALCACSTEMVIDEKPMVRDQQGFPSMGVINNPTGDIFVIPSPSSDECKPFVLSQKEILEYIHNARRIPAFDPQVRQPDEPALCAITYEGKTRNGRPVALFIDETRRGILHYIYPFDMKDEFYYCSNCRSPKYSTPPDQG